MNTAKDFLAAPTQHREPVEDALAALERGSKSVESFIDQPAHKGAPPQRTASSTLFNGGLETARPAWRSQVTSLVAHTAAIFLILLISVPAIEEIQRPATHITLLAPIPEYKPKLPTPPRIQKPRPTLKKLVLPPPVVKRIEKSIPAPPVIKNTPIAAALPALQPDIKAPEPAPAPKPQVRTGAFETQNVSKATGPKQIKTGGFGDPNGVQPSAQPASSLQMAKFGQFDLPNGAALGGGGGHGQGSVRTGGFGDGSASGSGSGSGNGHGGAVRGAGFGDAAVRTQETTRRPTQPSASTTVPEILFKPKPTYTDEARALKIEGSVELEVVFEASGAIRILRVVHGLGHGLDEAAQQAAKQIRFRPATQAGVPVDTNGMLYIVFQLT